MNQIKFLCLALFCFLQITLFSYASITETDKTIHSDEILTPPVEFVFQPLIYCNQGQTFVLFQLVASGGSPGYTYSVDFSGGGFAAIITPPGGNSFVAGQCGFSYPVTVTDSAGTTFTDSISITCPPATVNLQFNLTQPTCTADGDIDMTISGGSASLSWEWFDQTNNSLGTAQDLFGLAPGNYTVVWTDPVSNCTGSEVVILESPCCWNIEFALEEKLDCQLCDGYINVTYPPDISINSIMWTGPSGFTSTSLNIVNLCQGQYTLTVNYNNNCQTTLTVDFEEEICDGPVLCEFITDLVDNDQFPTTGQDITVSAANYTLVGARLSNPNNQNIYALTRDLQDNFEASRMIGDGANMIVREQTNAVFTFDGFRYTAGFRTRDDRTDVHVSCYNANTNTLVWSRIYDFDDVNQEAMGVVAFRTQFQMTDRVYITGHTDEVDPTGRDMFLMRVNAVNGNLVDLYKYGSEDMDELSNSITFDPNSETLIMAGEQNNSAALVRSTQNGIILNTNTLDLGETAYHSVGISNGNAYAAGRSLNDILLTQFNPANLNIASIDRIIASGNRSCVAHDLESRGNDLYLTGMTQEDGNELEDGFYIHIDDVSDLNIAHSSITNYENFSERFNALEVSEENNIYMVGDINLGNDEREILFVRANQEGVVCCMEPYEFNPQASPTFLDDSIREIDPESTNDFGYGQEQSAYEQEIDCTGVEFQGEIEVTERKIDSKSELTISPNPSTGQFEISFSGENELKSILVMNSNGQQVTKFELNPKHNNQIDLTESPDGIYFVRLQFEDGEIRSEKIIKVN